MSEKMEEIVPTQADIEAARMPAADLLDEISSLLDHNGIGQVADLIRDGEYDEHEATVAFARHAAQARAEVHQQMVVLMLDFVGGRALHEEHDEAGEDTDRDPVVRCFHFPPSTKALWHG